MKYEIISKEGTSMWRGTDVLEAAENIMYKFRDCKLVAIWDNIEQQMQHKRNMDASIERYRKRVQIGGMTTEEFERACEWARKNYESGNVLYAYKLAKAFLKPFKNH